MNPIKYKEALRKSKRKAFREAPSDLAGNSFDLQKRLNDLSKYGIDLQVTHPSFPPTQSLTEEEEAESDVTQLNRELNDGLADQVRESNGKIMSVAYVSPSLVQRENDQALDEMKRSITELGLKGFVVQSHIRGKAIDEFPRFWEEVAKFDLPVFIHPSRLDTTISPYEQRFWLAHILGLPYETSLVLSRLVFSGTMERIPGLKIVAHHMGGMIPFFAGRISETYDWAGDRMVSSHLSKSPLEYFRTFYYDTAVGGSANAIKCGYEVFGADHLVFSADYPAGPDGGAGRLRTYPDIIRKLPISVSEQNRILDTNMRRLVRIT